MGPQPRRFQDSEILLVIIQPYEESSVGPTVNFTSSTSFLENELETVFGTIGLGLLAAVVGLEQLCSGIWASSCCCGFVFAYHVNCSDVPDKIRI